MKRNLKLFFLLVTVAVYSQSPWTKEKGKFYTQISFSSIANYTSLFGTPAYTIQRELTDNTFQLYGEYGITNQTSLLVNIPLKQIQAGEFNSNANDVLTQTAKGTITSLGNIEIGVKHNFYAKNWLVSGQLSVETNTSSFDTSTGIRTGYNAYTITPLFLMGKGFGKSYLQAFIGANIRTNDYSSNFKIGGEYGKKITSKIWLVGFIDIVKSLENGNIILPTENIVTGLYVNNQEYGGFGLKGIGEFSDNFGITAGFGGAFFGNNVARAPALNIGLYHKF